MATLAFDILARDKASPTMDRVGKKFEGLATKATAVGTFLGNAATGGVVALGKLAFAAGRTGIQTAASLEQAQVGFTTLIGSGAKAQKFLGKLSAFAAATPFELPGLIDSSRLLLGVGVSADKVIPMLTAFGDAAGAVGVGQDAFQRIMLATSQAISAGRFQVGDLNQIVTNGIPAWKLLSESTGKSVPQLRKMASEGKLLARDVLPALQTQMEKDYGGAMAKQSKTLAGVWSTLMDSLNIGLANVIKPLVPWLTDMIPRAAAVLSSSLAGAGQGIQIFIDAFSGRSEFNEFDGWLKKVNNAGIITAEVFASTRRVVGGFLTEVRTGTGTGGQLAGTLMDTAAAAKAAAGFLSRHTEILKGLAGVTAAVVVLTKAHTAALTVQAAGGFAAWIGSYLRSLSLVAVALKVATAVQWLWNIALDANPIGLVIVAVGALVAAVVLLWQNNETFRRVVLKVWADVRAGVGAAVDWITKTAVPAVLAAWAGISAAAVGLWRGVTGAWAGIVAAVQAGVGGVVAVGRGIGSAFVSVAGTFAAAGRGIAAALAPVGAVILWLWRNIATPAFQAIGVLMQIWDRITQIAVKSIQIQFIIMGRVLSFMAGQVMTGLRLIGSGMQWLTDISHRVLVAGIAAAAAQVGALFSWLWRTAVAPALHAIQVALSVTGSAALWLWRSAVAPAFAAIGSAISSAWSKVVAPVLAAWRVSIRALGDSVSFVWRKVLLPSFNALRDFVQNKVAPAFAAGVAAIGKAWDGLKDKAKEPIRFVVNNVINSGVIDTFNKVAGYFGVKGVAHVNLPKGFAAGGVFNEPTAIVGEGGPAPEYVIPTDRKHRKRALALWEAAGAKLMASGGILGWLSDPIGSARSAMAGPLASLGAIEGSPLGRLAAAVPRRLAGSFGSAVERMAGNLASSAGSALLGGGGGSAAVRRVGQRLAAQAGWGSAGEWAALDALWTHESGWNPAAKNPSSTAFGIPQFLKSTAGAYGLAYGSTDPVAQIRAGLAYIKDAYGDPVRAWRAWQSRSPHWYGAGGTITEPIIGQGLRTGQTYGFGEHGPETVTPGRGAGGGGGELHVHFHGPVGSQQQMQDWLARSLDQLRRSGRLPRTTSVGA